MPNKMTARAAASMMINGTKIRHETFGPDAYWYCDGMGTVKDHNGELVYSGVEIFIDCEHGDNGGWMVFEEGARTDEAKEPYTKACLAMETGSPRSVRPVGWHDESQWFTMSYRDEDGERGLLDTSGERCPFDNANLGGFLDGDWEICHITGDEFSSRQAMFAMNRSWRVHRKGGKFPYIERRKDGYWTDGRQLFYDEVNGELSSGGVWELVSPGKPDPTMLRDWGQAGPPAKPPLHLLDMTFAAAMCQVFEEGNRDGRKAGDWREKQPTPENLAKYQGALLRHFMGYQDAMRDGRPGDAREHLASVACNANILWVMAWRAE